MQEFWKKCRFWGKEVELNEYLLQNAVPNDTIGEEFTDPKITDHNLKYVVEEIGRCERTDVNVPKITKLSKKRQRNDNTFVVM